MSAQFFAELFAELSKALSILRATLKFCGECTVGVPVVLEYTCTSPTVRAAVLTLLEQNNGTATPTPLLPVTKRRRSNSRRASIGLDLVTHNSRGTKGTHNVDV
jgi:hypothetical protein